MSRRVALAFTLKKIKAKEPSLFFYTFIYTITAGLLPAVAVVFPKYIINNIVNNELDNIYYLIFLMGGILIIFGGISTFLFEFCRSKFLKLRMVEFAYYFNFHLNTKYQYIEDPAWRDMSQRSIETLSNDEEGYQGTIKALFCLFAYFLSTGIYIYFIVIFNPLIILLIVIGSIISIFLNKYAKDYRLKNDDKIQRQNRRLSYYSNITSDFSYNKDIRIYSLKDKILEILRNENLLYIRIWKRIKLRQFLYAFIEFIIGLIQDGLAYYLLIEAAVNNKISMGEFTMFCAMVIALKTVLRNITDTVSNIYEWLGLTSKYIDLVNNEKYKINEEGIIPRFDDTLEIEFKNVTFKYPNTDIEVIKDFSFKIEKGCRLGLIGVNGAGKSTIVKLITGLFEPTSGEILINGVEIREYNRRLLYQEFGVVFQEINIFAFSILENVSMQPALQTNQDLVIECLKSVGLWEKIEQLPNGLNTNMLKILDETGIEFSGGESQKLVIARGLYQQGKCIILDEPTSALDALAEAKIYEDFNHMVANKTAIYISHRLASTKFCDMIALFTKEGLKEYGNHEELMAKKGLYYDMFITQGKYYQKEGA